MAVVPPGVGAGVLTAGIGASPYLAAGMSAPGKAMKAAEKEAAHRVTTPGSYGLTEAQKRSMIADTVRAMTQQTKETLGDIGRTARAKGALAGGQALQAVGQVGRGVASGVAQAGGKIAELSSQVAQQQKAADIAAVQNAYQRRVAQLKDWLQPGLEKATTTMGLATAGDLAGGVGEATDITA